MTSIGQVFGLRFVGFKTPLQRRRTKGMGTGAGDTRVVGAVLASARTVPHG